MPPKDYSSTTVPDEVFEQVTTAMSEHNCESIADAVALERDEAQLAQIFVRQLAK